MAKVGKTNQKSKSAKTSTKTLKSAKAPVKKKVAAKSTKPAHKATKPAVKAEKVKAAPKGKTSAKPTLKAKPAAVAPKNVVPKAPVAKITPPPSPKSVSVEVKPTAPKPVAPKEGAKEKKSAPVQAEVMVADLKEEQLEEASEEVVITDAEGRRYCRVKDCDQLAMVDTYCRYHYLLFWKRIQVRKKILTEGKLERYIEELTARYPDKFLDMLRKDLRSEKEFLAAIQELEIDESQGENEFEEESENFIEEVRGMSSDSAGSSDDEY